MTTIGEAGSPRAAAIGGVILLVGTLGAAYAISQLVRNSVGVIAPDLAGELGLSASQIGLLSSVFFFAFAAAQLPLGVALDRWGPKRCMLGCAAIVVVGTLLFAWAATPAGLIAARILMGLGTSCYLMAPLALYAQRFAANRFAVLAGFQLGIGTSGTLLATAPLAFSTAAMGWRATFVVIAIVMAIAGALIALVVRDDAPGHAAGAPRESLWQGLVGVREAMATDSVGRLFLMNLSTYASFVLVVGLWGGPYLTHVYGLTLTERGNLLLIPAITQIIGMMAWGPADRLFGGHKSAALLGAGLTALLLVLLAVVGKPPLPVLIAGLALFGFVASYMAVVVAHGKSLFAPRLVGRGLTLLNMAAMGGAFLSQTVSGFAIDLFPAVDGVYPLVAYRLVFALQAAFVVVTCVAYAGARDPTAHKPA
jgi:MFS family permease